MKDTCTAARYRCRIISEGQTRPYIYMNLRRSSIVQTTVLRSKLQRQPAAPPRSGPNTSSLEASRLSNWPDNKDTLLWRAARNAVLTQRPIHITSKSALLIYQQQEPDSMTSGETILPGTDGNDVKALHATSLHCAKVSVL